MRKQLALMALIDTMTTTTDAEKGKLACQKIVGIIGELKSMDSRWF